MPTSACDNGLAVDIQASNTNVSIRVLGVVSVARPPETWEDDDSPRLDRHEFLVAYHTDDFWLGVFAPDTS